MAAVDWKGYEKLQRALAKIGEPDPSPLLRNWERIIVEGNRRGVLAGVDGNNRPMPDLKYRNGRGRPTTNRLGRGFGKAGKTTGFGPFARGLHDNLTTAEYQRLTGPRLAPRRMQSRAIKNLMTQHGRDPGNRNQWFAEGAWDSVVSVKGVPFLPVHFEGKRAGRGTGFLMPRYDLRPVRPEDRKLAKAEMVKWAHAMIQEAFRG